MRLTCKLFSALIFIGAIACSNTHKPQTREVWTPLQAHEWYSQHQWLRGANFQPSTAINQLEMWQAETFDTATINRELGWAANIGFNCMRVYLHHLAWKIDSIGFKNRMDTYLAIADKYQIKTIFVFFDDCWNPTYKAGIQPAPKPGIHNSGWVRDPGDNLFQNPVLIDTLESYVKDILTTFSADKRILLWDVYNEPGNSNYGVKSKELLEKVFIWGREINPSQPLSSGVWNKKLTELNAIQLANSDIITYHDYSDSASHRVTIDSLKKLGKPMICTEYLARTRNSFFQTIMPMLKHENIGAINWGLVSGKTNTKYAWDTPLTDGSEPAVWFHDIFRPDGTPYDSAETKLIKQLANQ